MFIMTFHNVCILAETIIYLSMNTKRKVSFVGVCEADIVFLLLFLFLILLFFGFVVIFFYCASSSESLGFFRRLFITVIMGISFVLSFVLCVAQCENWL